MCIALDKPSKGFWCDVISSQFCKSSYSRPQCWFPVTTGRYKEIQQSVPVCLVHITIPNYKRVTKLQRILLFFSIPRHTKGNQVTGKILRVSLRTATCKPSFAHDLMLGTCLITKSTRNIKCAMHNVRVTSECTTQVCASF